MGVWHIKHIDVSMCYQGVNVSLRCFGEINTCSSQLYNWHNVSLELIAIRLQLSFFSLKLRQVGQDVLVAELS